MPPASQTWQPDSDAAECFLCQDLYTFFNRRHHCRKCGRVVCASCSSQIIKYFPNSPVLHAEGTLRAHAHEYYRTCDECVDEIRMIRRALFEPAAEENLGLPESDFRPPLLAPSDLSIGSTAKYATRVTTRLMDLASSLLKMDAQSDDNLCPVCGAELLTLYVRLAKHDHRDLSHTDYEAFKEAHISECLVAFDFNLDHQRLSSPPGPLQMRNRMLVYNIPPIPRPKYEIIGGTSVDTLRNEVCGLVNSSSTVQLEKDVTENECVICLDDLKPGDKVSRLECLCVFHYVCIKDWFNKKGYGECPVHFLHH